MTSNGLFQGVSQVYPKDLRGLSPLEAGGGKMYPVDPEAARKLREFHEQQAREKEAREKEANEVMEQLKKQLKSRSKGKKVTMNSKPVVEPVEQRNEVEERATAVAEDLYSAEVRAAAAVEMAKPPVERRYGKVLTPEVLDIWQRWVDEGKTPEWIGENNGLIPITPPTVRNYLSKHRKTAVSSKPPKVAKRTVLAVPVVPEKVVEETAVSEPEPTPEPAPDQTLTAAAGDAQNGRFVATRPENLPAFLDRDALPTPRPLDGLAALLQLVQSDQVKVRGSVKLNLNLEVDFGGGAE